MKFGSHLKDAMYPEWTAYYIDYDSLKKKLRKAEKDRPFTEKDETEFVELLDNNLEKVYAFHQDKMEEIKKRINLYDDNINKNDLLTEEEMSSIQENINWVADDINRLARYSRINYTGFLKIIKKHDRHTDYILRPMFMVRLNQCPFWNEKSNDNDGLLLKLSTLFSKVREGGLSMSFKPTYHQEQQQLEEEGRNLIVKRFFVQPENILELKTYVLRHLPVLVYRDHNNISNDQDNIDPPVSSLYLDNTDLDSYNSRLEGAEGSQIIRLRWYGSVKRNRSISFELRTLAEESRGELKNRFTIKDKHVSNFLQGDQAFIEKSIQKMKNSGRSDEEINNYRHLIKHVQNLIHEKQMQPVLRTYYRRTAFQIPGDRTVRMALDTDLCFIREDSKLFPDDDRVRRPDNHWCRPDVDINFPFNNIQNENDINRYPFATFEIKLELASNEKMPEWISDLEESGILEEASDFSKFVHGIAVMFDTRVSLLPYWLAQMDNDIDQLPTLPSNTPSVVVSSTSSQKKHPKNKSVPASVSSFIHSDISHQQMQRSSSTNSDNERTSLLRNNNKAVSYMGTYQNDYPPSHQPAMTVKQIRNKSFASRLVENINSIFFNHFNSQQQEQHQRQINAPPVILPTGVKIPQKVFRPIRVEPKVFFANERTYFSWMSFGTLLSTFSLALFNAGDAVGKVSGVMYTLVSISTLIYGVGLYYRRRELIRNRAAGPYDETVGPTVICFALLFAVALNTYLKFTVKAPSLLYF
ncbi:VTC domain-containing protein [Cokeromyces recurvatus]|uniref:VTC domain-containing protein n=1 Tax=Cokeromyces recurvatus TaxID=90255 RepID=UPI002220878D|nr:VTC domain-containing protein [Cokeromyces recurvatus]KAI7897871.1 VTC domain-containing protein [Cokeromyces recurvatus]